MRPVGYGRPGTEVIPAGWVGIGAAVFGDTFDCTVRIGAAGGEPVWNPDTEQTETPMATPVYEGPASISAAANSTATVDVADDLIPLVRYLVELPVDTAGISDEHFVEVVACPDAMLTGRRLDINAVVRGGRRFTRLLLCGLQD